MSKILQMSDEKFTIFHVELKKLRKQNKLMEEKLEKYRAKKRRQARINDFKTRLINMVTFQQVRVDSANKNDHVIVQDITDHIDDEAPATAENIENYDLLSVSSDDECSSLQDLEADTIKEPTSYLTYLTYFLYFCFWATCWLIAIELKFGLVFLLFSALFGIYFNTRTRPKLKNEISAYSVFNENCTSIDGTLTAEQFEREIRYGPMSVK